MNKYITLSVVLSVLVALMAYELLQPYWAQGVRKITG